MELVKHFVILLVESWSEVRGRDFGLDWNERQGETERVREKEKKKETEG